MPSSKSYFVHYLVCEYIVTYFLLCSIVLSLYIYCSRYNLESRVVKFSPLTGAQHSEAPWENKLFNLLFIFLGSASNQPVCRKSLPNRKNGCERKMTNLLWHDANRKLLIKLRINDMLYLYIKSVVLTRHQNVQLLRVGLQWTCKWLQMDLIIYRSLFITSCDRYKSKL